MGVKAKDAQPLGGKHDIIMFSLQWQGRVLRFCPISATKVFDRFAFHVGGGIPSRGVIKTLHWPHRSNFIRY